MTASFEFVHKKEPLSLSYECLELDIKARRYISETFDQCVELFVVCEGSAAKYREATNKMLDIAVESQMKVEKFVATEMRVYDGLHLMEYVYWLLGKTSEPSLPRVIRYGH